MFVQDYSFVEMFEPFNENLEVTVSMLGDFDPYKLSLEHDLYSSCSPSGLVLTLQTCHSVRVCQNLFNRK
jgi:hypothetical protein